MTNVQTTRRPSYFGVTLALSLTAVLTTTVSTARAAGPFTFSHTPVSSGASEVIEDMNRRSFGTVFRGGHTVGDSVGRQDTLTHVSLAPYFNAGPALFMGDARLGRANRGGLTWSFGGILRTFVEDWDVVTGANIYHSGDNITGTQLRTWGVGVDVLANDWEARANYVRPNGETSVLTGRSVDQASAMYAGNNIVFNRRDTVAEALEKMDVEAGMRLPIGPIHNDNVHIKGFVGAYRFQGETISATTGWKTRLLAEIGDYLELGVGLNQDALLDTLVFFNATVTFGGFTAQDYTKNCAIQRLADPVRRDLTVASLRTDVVVPDVVAINPTDGLPLVVRHVDENDIVGPFLGTVEDPLQSISTALGLPGTDVVLTHAGGLYNAVPDNEVTVGPNVSLFGEGLIPNVHGDRIAVNTIPVLGIPDELILPPSPTFAANMTLARPVLLGAAGDSVTLSANSRFGSFVVDGAGGAGIASDNAGSTTVRDVQVQNSGGAGILLTNTTETTTIIDSIIRGATGPALHVNGGDGSIGMLSNSIGLIPSFSHIENTSQQIILIENLAAGGIVNTTGTTLEDTSGAGIDILNSAGSATVDNARVVNSTATGIRVMNSSGIYNFRNSIQDNTFISNAAQQSVLIDGLGANGQVTFNTLQIDGRNSTGIDINTNGGRITFMDPVVLGTPNGGAGAGISVDGSTAGSTVLFNDLLSMTGSGGPGIELTGNLAGSSFTVEGAVALDQTTGDAISMSAQGGGVGFNGAVTASNRGGRGISVQNSTGNVSFLGPVTINNELNVLTPAVDIRNSESNVLFTSLSIVNAMGNPGGGAGVHLAGNLAGGTNSALHTYQTVNIESVDGVGFLANNNTRTRILGGTVTSTGAAAINLEQTVSQVDVDSVSSTNSPDFGIRVVNAGEDSSFIVNDELLTPAPGTGGTIQGADIAAVLLENAGQVRLRGLQFDSNARDIFLTNSGLTEDDDQLLVVQSSAFLNTAGTVIDAQNLTTLVVEDSLFDGGGVNSLTYNERTNDQGTTKFDQFDNPYEVFWRRNVIDNSVVVQGLAGAADAHLNVEYTNNIATLGVAAVTVDWTGPSRVVVGSNAITLNANDALDVVHRSTTDEMLLSVLSNQLVASADDSTGLNVQTFGQSDILIDGNESTFGGLDSTGMQFNLAPDTELFLSNNELRFDADGGAGVIFTRVNQPSAFTIDNNSIGLFDDGPLIEEGLRFLTAVGTSTLSGTINNRIFLLNPLDPAAFIEIPFSFGGLFNGQIPINGGLQP